MKRALILAALALAAGSAFAQTAFVTDSITYVEGGTRPLTIDTDGKLRVSCN